MNHGTYYVDLLFVILDGDEGGIGPQDTTYFSLFWVGMGGKRDLKTRHVLRQLFLTISFSLCLHRCLQASGFRLQAVGRGINLRINLGINLGINPRYQPPGLWGFPIERCAE